MGERKDTGYDREAAQELQGYIELEAYDAVPRKKLEEVQAALATAEAQVEARDAQILRERHDFKILEAQDSRTAEHRDELLAQLEVYREALYAIQNEPSCSPVVHELAGSALAGEKP